MSLGFHFISVEILICEVTNFISFKLLSFGGPFGKIDLLFLYPSDIERNPYICDIKCHEKIL